jgi:hypothetical protein
MARKTVWHDDYWLLLMQVYLKRPVGMKALYSRDMVAIAMELHISPEQLQARMKQIATLETPRVERLMKTYANNPKKLKRAVGLLRQMKGYGNADEFYEGVAVNETFERDFRPLAEDERLTPVALTLVLDLYYHLTPATMVARTPEVVELARLLKVSASDVEDLLNMYQHCDPYLNRSDVVFSPLMLPCQQVWQRYADRDPAQIAVLADALKQYYM